MFSKYYFCILFVTLIAKSLSRTLGPVELSCVEDNKLNPDGISKYNAGDFIPEDDQDYLKFTECFYTKLNLYDENSQLKVDGFKEVLIAYKDTVSQVDKDIIDLYIEGMNECGEKTYEGSKGEVVLKFNNCVIKNKFMI